MTFSKSFILIASILLVLVGAALGYSVKMFLQVGGMSHRLELIDYDVRALEYRIFLLENKGLRTGLPGERKISFHGLGTAGRKGQPQLLPVSQPPGRK